MRLLKIVKEIDRYNNNLKKKRRKRLELVTRVISGDTISAKRRNNKIRQ